MKAFRLGKSKKNSKGQLRKDSKTISSTASNSSLRSNLKNDKNQTYTTSLYNSMGRNVGMSSSSGPINSNNSYTSYLSNGTNNSINRKNSSLKSLPRNMSNAKNQIVPEFRVGIRLRPMLEVEKNDTENEELVYLFPKNNLLCIREPGSDHLPEIDDGPPPPPGTIAPSMGPYISTNPFNYVFSNVNSQENVYYQSVHSLVEHFHKGKNSLVLAYGQMGSGKTYTIGFQPEDYSLENFNPDIIGNDLGFVPRAFQETLSYIHLLKSQGRTANLLVTFIAISCEDIADLLGESITRYRRPPSPGPKMSSPNDKRDPTTQPKTITVHDRGKQGIYLKGAKYERVESMERLAELLYRGTTFRRIVFGPDSENLSHAILSFQLEQDNPKSSKDKMYSKINFVDLSCTEKIDKVEARMNRMECGVNDKSWLALSKVINLLTANRPKAYIPYRDSKLTQVLQDSLSNDSIVLFLSCLSPTACDENKSVLKYMIRSTNIDQRKTDVSPKLLKEILYNLENMREDSPTSPVNINSPSSQSGFNGMVNVDGSSSLARTNLNRKINYKTPLVIPNSTVNEGDNNNSPGGPNPGRLSISIPNQSLDSINTSINTSSMSRLIANSSLLFSTTPESPSPIMGSLYEEEIKRKSMSYGNIGNNNINSNIDRSLISKRTSSLNPTSGLNSASSLNPEEDYSKIQNRTSPVSMHSVPSINSIRSYLVKDGKSSNAGMTQMLEDQLKTLNSLSEENTSRTENHPESKGHRKKNSEGKKRISFHKRVLSFHKAFCFDSNKQEENKIEKEQEPTTNPVPVPVGDYKEIEKMRSQNNENVNNHIAFMLEEIKSTMGEKAISGKKEGNDKSNMNRSSSYNLEELIYYVKILLQDYSENQDQVEKLTAIINNSNIVNNSNYLNDKPLSAVVSDVDSLKYAGNLESSISKTVSSRTIDSDMLNIVNSTPPPSYSPPPVPTESVPTMPQNYKGYKTNGNGSVVMNLIPKNNISINTTSTATTTNNATEINNNNSSINNNNNNVVNGNSNSNTNGNGNSNSSGKVIANTNANVNGNIKMNNTPLSSSYAMDITTDMDVSVSDIQSINLSNDDLTNVNRKNNIKDHNLSVLISKGKSVLKNSSIYNGNNSSGDSPSIKSPNSILKNGSSYNNNNNSNGNNNNSLLSINSPNAYIEDMALEDMDQAELNKYITNLSIRLKNSIKEVKEEKDKCDLLRQKEKNLERKLRIRDKELESLHIELDEKINSFNNAVKVLVVQLGMAQESKSKTQEELSSVEYRTMELAKSLETISELMNGERKSTRNAEDKYHNFVAEYEEEINLLQGEKSHIIHEKESLKQQNANLQAKINKLVKTLKKFQVNLIESEKRNYYESAANLSNLKNENDLLKRKLDEINKTKSYIENRYHQLQADYERQQAVTNPNVNNSYYDQEDDQSHLAQQAKEYKKELEKVKVQLRETEEAHQTEIYKLLDRLALAEGKAGKKRESSSSYKRNSSSNYIAELEKKLEKSYSIQKELKEKLKKSETLMNKKLLENKELEGRCLSYKKSLTTLQDTVSTYENHQTKLLNTNYNLSSQLNNGKKGKFINTRSYSGFRTIMNDIKKMTVTELQDEVVELRQEVESMNKKNWDLKLEVDRYQSANESNRRTIMVLMKRINDERNNDKKEEDTMVEGERSTTFTKDTSNIRNSSSSMNSRHESNATLLNSEAFDDEYSSKTSINKLPVLSEVDNEILIHEGSEEEETANVSPFLVNKSNSSSSSTAVNLPIHALPNDDGFKDTTETHSLSQPSSSSDFSMIKVNDEVCIRESTISTDSIKYSSYHDY